MAANVWGRIVPANIRGFVRGAVERMYSSRFALHFYGREAMDKARARWSEVRGGRQEG
jgi:hypothetical protein